MMEFFQAGGFAMWFVLLFALVTLVSAVIFAVKADLKKLSLVRAMTTTTIFATIAGVFLDLLAVSRYVGHDDEVAKGPDFARILVVGFGESITPAILGFSLLAVSWLVVAVGTRRVQDPID